MIDLILPKYAWGKLENNSNAVLIDVRCQPEWQFVGIPDLSEINRKVFFIPWNIYPNMDVNINFLEDLEKTLVKNKFKINDNLELFFICRTGGRSAKAADFCYQNGFKNCFNIEYGFEGDIDEKEQRGNINGWKADNLSWRQS